MKKILSKKDFLLVQTVTTVLQTSQNMDDARDDKDDDVDDNLSLRSPLGKLHLKTEKFSGSTHDQAIHSQLHGLLVGANFLKLSAETCFRPRSYCIATVSLRQKSIR
jgi:hypothetical protein